MRNWRSCTPTGWVASSIEPRTTSVTSLAAAALGFWPWPSATILSAGHEPANAAPESASTVAGDQRRHGQSVLGEHRRFPLWPWLRAGCCSAARENRRSAGQRKCRAPSGWVAAVYRDRDRRHRLTRPGNRRSLPVGGSGRIAHGDIVRRSAPATASRSDGRADLRLMTLAALGVVYGDIGTSPLYTLREAFGHAGGLHLSQPAIYGVLSLVFWSLILVVTVKYVILILRADNRGEGGVLALGTLGRPGDPRAAAAAQPWSWAWRCWASPCSMATG